MTIASLGSGATLPSLLQQGQLLGKSSVHHGHHHHGGAGKATETPQSTGAGNAAGPASGDQTQQTSLAGSLLDLLA
jgi:hypothetical protein